MRKLSHPVWIYPTADGAGDLRWLHCHRFAVGSRTRAVRGVALVALASLRLVDRVQVTGDPPHITLSSDRYAMPPPEPLNVTLDVYAATYTWGIDGVILALEVIETHPNLNLPRCQLQSSRIPMREVKEPEAREACSVCVWTQPTM